MGKLLALCHIALYDSLLIYLVLFLASLFVFCQFGKFILLFIVLQFAIFNYDKVQSFDSIFVNSFAAIVAVRPTPVAAYAQYSLMGGRAKRNLWAIRGAHLLRGQRCTKQPPCQVLAFNVHN